MSKRRCLVQSTNLCVFIGCPVQRNGRELLFVIREFDRDYRGHAAEMPMEPMRQTCGQMPLR